MNRSYTQEDTAIWIIWQGLRSNYYHHALRSKGEHSWNKWKQSTSQETEAIKKNPIYILELKSSLAKIKYSVWGLHIEMEVTGEREIDLK